MVKVGVGVRVRLSRHFMGWIADADRCKIETHIGQENKRRQGKKREYAKTTHDNRAREDNRTRQGKTR